MPLSPGPHQGLSARFPQRTQGPAPPERHALPARRHGEREGATGVLLEALGPRGWRKQENCPRWGGAGEREVGRGAGAEQGRAGSSFSTHMTVQVPVFMQCSLLRARHHVLSPRCLVGMGTFPGPGSCEQCCCDSSGACVLGRHVHSASLTVRLQGCALCLCSVSAGAATCVCTVTLLPHT